MSEVVHIASHPICIGSRVRQRCAWCGAVIDDTDLRGLGVAVTPGDDEPPTYSGSGTTATALVARPCLMTSRRCGRSLSARRFLMSSDPIGSRTGERRRVARRNLRRAYLALVVDAVFLLAAVIGVLLSIAAANRDEWAKATYFLIVAYLVLDWSPRRG